MKRFSHLVDGNNRERLPDGRKGMHKVEKNKDVKKVYARARKVLQRGVGNSVWAVGVDSGEVGGSGKKFTERGQQKEEFVSGQEARRSSDKQPHIMLRTPLV